jgi:hypothetical protein
VASIQSSRIVIKSSSSRTYRAPVFIFLLAGLVYIMRDPWRQPLLTELEKNQRDGGKKESKLGINE